MLSLQSTDILAILHLLYEYTGQQIVYHSAVELNKFHPRMSVIAEEQIVSFYKKQITRCLVDIRNQVQGLGEIHKIACRHKFRRIPFSLREEVFFVCVDIALFYFGIEKGY